jgi:hypothetical protein
MLEAPDRAGIIWRADINVNSGLGKNGSHMMTGTLLKKILLLTPTSRCIKQQTSVIIHM